VARAAIRGEAPAEFLTRILRHVPAGEGKCSAWQLTYDSASRITGSTKPAVDSLDLAIKDGEFSSWSALGCGKSTALRMLAGWRTSTAAAS